MDICPGGEEDSEDGHVAAYLCNMSNKSIKIQFGFSVRDVSGKEVVYYEPNTNKFDCVGVVGHVNTNAWGIKNFGRRSELLDALIEGALVVEVRMRMKAIEVRKQFIPDNPINKNILSKFNKQQSADVVFEVDDSIVNEQGGDGSSRKRAKTTTTFYAHRVILEDAASTLTEMCKPSAGGGDSTTSVTITDVEPEIFKHMLYYMYGGKLTGEELEVNAEEIINACDKYGVVSLKLEAEASFVKSTTITVENMMDNLLYADSKNLALLNSLDLPYLLPQNPTCYRIVYFFLPVYPKELAIPLYLPHLMLVEVPLIQHPCPDMTDVLPYVRVCIDVILNFSMIACSIRSYSSFIDSKRFITPNPNLIGASKNPSLSISNNPTFGTSGDTNMKNASNVFFP